MVTSHGEKPLFPFVSWSGWWMNFIWTLFHYICTLPPHLILGLSRLKQYSTLYTLHSSPLRTTSTQKLSSYILPPALNCGPPVLDWTEGYQLILKSRDEAELSLVPGAVQNICKINLKLAKIMTSSWKRGMTKAAGHHGSESLQWSGWGVGTWRHWGVTREWCGSSEPHQVIKV